MRQHTVVAMCFDFSLFQIVLNSFLDLDASKLAFIPINQILTVFQVFKTIESVATIGFDPLFKMLKDKFLFK